MSRDDRSLNWRSLDKKSEIKGLNRRSAHQELGDGCKRYTDKKILLYSQ